MTAQQDWFDAQIRHQIGLLRVAGGIRNEVFELLDATERDLRSAINDSLRRGATPTRLRSLFEKVRDIRNPAWTDVRALWLRSMREIVRAEPLFTDALLKSVVPVELSTTLPPARQLQSIVSTNPFEGHTMARWGSRMNARDIDLINREIRIGVVQGESAQDISRRVVGTVSRGGSDGITATTRRNSDAITRTAVNHYANQARRDYFEENSDIVDEEIYVATLDSRTTAICRSLDGKRFPLGEGNIPPLHFNCRSIRTAILDEEALGDRPANPTTERQLLREFAAREGISPVPRSRSALPRGTKGAFDQFSRVRTRELIGTVPAHTTYQQWLSRQSAAIQDDILGPTRGRLFRQGELTLDSFVDRSGAEIPLRDLSRMHAEAFEKAGISPQTLQPA